MKNFSIVTFNIYNVWRLNRKAWNRDDLAAEVLREMNGDVVCLQEFDGPFRHEELSLPQMLADLYDEATPQEVDPDDNWNPIFYRKDRFRVEAAGHHVYTCGTEYTYRETGRSHFRTITWAVLSERDGADRRIILNTHYDTDTANHKSESDELIELSVRLQKEWNAPVLVTGDYNCRNYGIAVQNMFAAGFVDTCMLAAVQESHMGCHPYPILNEEKQVFDAYDDHFYAETYREAIDHVMILGEAEVDLYRTVINEKTLLISDHSPVIVQMRFDAKNESKA